MKTVTTCGYIITINRIVAIEPITYDKKTNQWYRNIIIDGMDNLILKAYDKNAVIMETDRIKAAMEWT